MSALVATIGAQVALGILLFSGITHARHHRYFKRVIQQQAVWPRRLESAVVPGLVVLELGISVIGLVVIVGPVNLLPMLRAALGGAVVLYTGFALYAARLLSQDTYASCGCSKDEDPVNVWTVARAIVLVGASIAGLISSESLVSAATLTSHALIMDVASIALGTIVWNLPSALHHPGVPVNSRLVEAANPS
jgi:hypothetical protein